MSFFPTSLDLHLDLYMNPLSQSPLLDVVYCVVVDRSIQNLAMLLIMSHLSCPSTLITRIAKVTRKHNTEWLPHCLFYTKSRAIYIEIIEIIHELRVTQSSFVTIIEKYGRRHRL